MSDTSSASAVSLDEIAARIKAAVEAVLAALPHAGCGPVVLNGSMSGHLMHDGHPETAVGFEVLLGLGPPPGWKK